MNVREQYAAGKRFRVVKEGASLVGMKPIPGGHQGWSRDLVVGEVIESRGCGAGWGSDPGYGVHFKEDGIAFAEFKPNGSGNWFTYYPDESYLEEVT
jgi:hypothetical protein